MGTKVNDSLHDGFENFHYKKTQPALGSRKASMINGRYERIPGVNRNGYPVYYLADFEDPTAMFPQGIIA